MQGRSTRKCKCSVLCHSYMVSDQKPTNIVTLKSTIHFISNLLQISFEVSDKQKSSQSTFPFLWGTETKCYIWKHKESGTLVKEWMNPDCLPPSQTLGLYHSSEPPNHSAASAPAWWVFKQKAHRPLGSFFFKILPLRQGSPSKYLLCRMFFATSIFGCKSCTESLSQLPQRRGEGCVLPGGKQSPATVTNGDMRSWHRGKGDAPSQPQLQTDKSSQGGCTRRKVWQAQKIIPLFYKFSFINSCILASRKIVCAKNLPGFADKRGILGES